MNSIHLGLGKLARNVSTETHQATGPGPTYLSGGQLTPLAAPREIKS
jgi:hypothetical protein